MRRWQSDDGRVSLLNADSSSVLDEIRKHALFSLVTDPPYGLGEKWNGGGGSSRSSWKHKPDEAKAWDGRVSECLLDYVRLASQSIVWGGNYYPLPVSRCWLIWDKMQPDTWTTGQCEMAWTSIDRPTRVFRMCQAVAHDKMRPKRHPTQKPVELMAWCLKWLSSTPTIIDPFMGSGTTGVACYHAGIPFVGIERDGLYFDIAIDRMKTAISQRTLFAPEVSLGQSELFAG